MRLSDLFEGVNDPNIFKAIIIVGSPGGGKSFIVNKLALRSQGLVEVTTDHLFEKFLKQYGLSLKMPDHELDTREQLRYKAFDLTSKRQQLLMDGRVGLVIEGTGYVDRVEDLRKSLSDIGYDVCLVFVGVDHETAQYRNARRERSLPPDTVTTLWKNAQQNKNTLKRMFAEDFFEVDTNNPTQVATLSRNIRKWLATPPKSPMARRWILSHRFK